MHECAWFLIHMQLENHVYNHSKAKTTNSSACMAIFMFWLTTKLIYVLATTATIISSKLQVYQLYYKFVTESTSGRGFRFRAKFRPSDVLHLMLVGHGDKEVGPPSHPVAKEVKLLRLHSCPLLSCPVRTGHSNEVGASITLE